MDSGKAFRDFLAGNPETGETGMLDKLNLSVDQLAKACGLSRNAVYLYLQGKSRPSSQTMHKMAVVLGLPVEELFLKLPSREAGAQKGKKRPSTKITA